MGTTAEKLSYLNETKTKIKNALETPYNVFRDYPAMIKKYIDNQPTKIATNGICDNAVELPIVSLKLDGNSEQKTTEGYNLLQNIDHKDDKSYTVNGVTFTKNSDGSIVANGNATETARYYLVGEGSQQRVEIKIGTYRVTGCPSGGSLSTYSMAWGITGLGEKYDLGDGINITLSSDTTYYFVVKIGKGQTVNNLVFKPMIISGTAEKSYEPYTGGTPSPNPDYPQEIETINSIGWKQSGKNLFDNTLKGYEHYGYTAKTITNGIRITAENDFTKGDALFGVYTIIDLSNYIGKVVRMQADIIPNKSTGAGAYRLGLSNKDSTNRKALAETGTKKEISFTVPELTGEQKYLAIWFYIGTTNSGTKGDYTDYTNIIVTIDNDDMTYEPYHEPKVISINLQGNTLAKVGDIKDILRVNRNGKIEIKKNIEKIVLTGSEKLVDKSSSTTRTYWAIDFSNYGIYQYDDSTKTCDILTTKFKSRPQRGSFLPGQVALMVDAKNVYFIFEPDTTEEQARAILTDMLVYFRLAEPQTIKLSSISPIELWQGTNIFKLITNLDTDFEVEYVVDKDSALDEVQTAMLDAEIEI